MKIRSLAILVMFPAVLAGGEEIIYCNNNFVQARSAFPTKLPTASLNLSTYIALFNYGYENVYELGPLLDARTTKIDLVSSPKHDLEGK